MNSSELQVSQRCALIVIFLVPLIVSPGINEDPVNISKLFTLSLLSFASFLPYLWYSYMSGTIKSLLKFLVPILLILFLPWLFSSVDLTAQFYGAFGRNNGLLSWISLVFLSFTIYAVTSEKFKQHFIKLACLSGLLVALYGVVQFLGLDPLSWRSLYVGAFSTMGNPNFFGALCGISFVMSACYWYALTANKKKSVKNRNLRVFLILVSICTFAGTLVSKSDQGVILMIFGICCILSYKLFIMKKIKNILGAGVILFTLTLLLVSITERLIFPGLFLESLNSLQIRLAFWKIGLNMFFDNPIFGVGYDYFGDWNRYYSANALGTDTNSAHNIFLDIGAMGGIGPLVLFISFVVLVTIKGIRVLRSSEDREDLGLNFALVVAWIAFLLQAIVSVGHLGLLVWGMALGSLILGSGVSKLKGDAYIGRRIPIALAIIGGVIGLLVVAPLHIKDHSFNTAKRENDILLFKKSINSFPYLPFYVMHGAKILNGAGYHGPAAAIAISGIERFPNNVQLRATVQDFRGLDSTWLARNQSEISRLDP